ncbi:MAG: glycosyltransferase family 2 protein, partial [Actinomycetota bacterium]
LLGDGIQRSPRRVGFLLGDGIQRPRSERAFRPHREVRRRLLDAVLAERVLRRQIDATRCQRSHGSADHVDVAETPTWAAAAADVSAIITLYDYADVVTEALDSLAASEDVDVEVVVVDDHSTDDGPAIVRAWMDQHPHVPVRLVARGANRGLAAARNLAIEHTRADRVMVLDADNAVYPTCLRRLADALDADTEAAFAWSILEVVGDEPGLLSAHAWDRDRLLERNRIDAQVMLRRSAIGSLGGYRTPGGLLLGWEDWDLWLRLVEEGGHGVLVPEMLGRYRSHEGSMVSGPNLFDDVMLERLEAAHPDLDFPPR